MMVVICIILSAALAAALFWLFLLKRDIACMTRNLTEIVHTDTNARITTNTFDKNATSLAEAINDMLEQNRRGLLKTARAETDLKQAVTNISHDLRTPLTSALGYLQMLASAGLDEKTKNQYTHIIRGRLESLSALMNSLFEFARVSEGSTAPDIQKVNICNAVRDTLSACYSELENKGFTVDAYIPDTPVFCLCDEDALRRVLQNLFRNVCVHGKQYLRVSINDGTIEIANKADGLAALDTERMFERFYTADASRTSQNTGLGLAICKELTRRMNGRITAVVEDDMLVTKIGCAVS